MGIFWSFVLMLSEQTLLSMAARMTTGTARSLIPMGSKHFFSSDLTGIDSLGPLGESERSKAMRESEL